MSTFAYGMIALGFIVGVPVGMLTQKIKDKF